MQNLLEIVRMYLEIQRQPARQADYDKLEWAFQQALQKTNQSTELRAALSLDRKRRLPVQIKSPIYERLMALEGRTPALLREYAQEMYDFGPEWTPYADSLWDEAKRSQ